MTIRQALGPEFDFDPIASQTAVTHGHCFTIMHMPSVFQFDIFPIGDDAFGKQELARRQFHEMSFAGGTVNCPILQPEDVILAKLRWRRESQSDRQWQDLEAIFELTGAELDYAYLREWGGKLNVLDDLEKLIGGGGTKQPGV